MALTLAGLASPKALLFVALGALITIFVGLWASSLRGDSVGRRIAAPLHWVIGFVVTFLDTLGIGSFATTTSLYKLSGLVRDEHIPGTLNVGITLPTVVQALIYITIVKVDMRTLVLMIAAAIAGAWLGAGVVCRWPRRRIQIGMGTALLVAAVLMLLTQQQLLPVGGATLELDGTRLAIGLAGNFVLGALMTLGIGLYAPCMILVSLLGMNPTAAFPIMMGSCAFLMPVASIRFVRARSYAVDAAIALAVAGIPAVILAASLVGSLSLTAVRWLVVCVVVYTGVMMLRSALKERRTDGGTSRSLVDPAVVS
jgi:uncharacterized membrane protein YfcA